MAVIRTYTLTMQGDAEEIDERIEHLEAMLECVGCVLVSEEFIENAEDNPEQTNGSDE